MSFNSCVVTADADTVFAVLLDPYTYPSWLVGNSEVRMVEPGWPLPGSRFHHRVGRWPLRISDSSKVLAIEPGRMLRLAVRARPLIRAIATFRVIGDGASTVVTLEEEPELRLVGNLVRVVMDPLTHVRNHIS